jgi:hypothetical protein
VGVNRRLGMVISVLIMGAIAFSLRQDGLLPEGWTPRPRVNSEEDDDSQETEDEAVDSIEPVVVELPQRRSATPRRGRLLGPPAPAEVRSASDSVHGQISGRVEDQVTGAPIPNARLTFRREEQLFDARSDDDGHFRFSAPNEGAFTLALAEAEGYFSYVSAFGDGDMVFVTSAEQSIDAVHIRLEAVAALRVLVHGLDGALVSSQIRVLGAADGELYDAPVGEAFVRAREDSMLEATSLSPRTLGYARLNASSILTGVLHIHARPVATHDTVLRGQVLSLLGSEPISGAQVEVESETREGNTLIAQLITGEDGHFSYEGDASGPFSVWAQAAGFATESRSRATRDAPVVLLLSEEASVVGRVVDEEGNPIPSFFVFAEAHVGELARHLRAQSGRFDARGEFRLGGLSSGGYTISVAANGYAPLTREVLLSRGDSARLRDFRLRRGAVLNGLVRGANGAALSGVRVLVESAIAGSGLPLSTEVQSNPEGAFRVDGLSPGQVFLTLAGAGHHARIVTAQTGGDRVDITLNEVTAGEAAELELAGIGAAVRAVGDRLVIEGLMNGGGAEAAGLAIGERIVQIDGVLVGTLSFRQSVARLRGPVDSRARLLVQGEEDERDVNVTRILLPRR